MVAKSRPPDTVVKIAIKSRNAPEKAHSTMAQQKRLKNKTGFPIFISYHNNNQSERKVGATPTTTTLKRNF